MKVKLIRLEGGTAVLCPVAGKILRARIGASAIRPLEYFPFGLAVHALRRFHRRATGAMVGCENQNRSLLSMKAFRSSTFTRSCCMVSRSRTVTEPSVSVSKSTVMQYGVPISSWRR